MPENASEDYLTPLPATGTPLPGLPGSDAEPGEGPAEPACFEALLADTADPSGHVQHRLQDHADLVGPLVLPASGLEAFRAAIPEGTHGLQVLLVADAADARDGLTTLREARNGLFDDVRVEVVGVQLALPAADDPGASAMVLLEALDFSVPTWVEVPPVPGWEAALDVLAADGNENLAVDLGTAPELLAAVVRRAVDRDLTFRGSSRDDRWAFSVSGDGSGEGGDGGPWKCGLLNLLCAVRATLNGAETPEVAAVLACQEYVPLVSAVRRMSEADAAVTRAFLASVDTYDVGGLVMDLRSFGLA